MGCDVLIAVLPMSNFTYSTKTVYAVVINRHGLCTKELANTILFYDTKEKAEEYANKVVTCTKYNLIRHAVSIIPFEVSGLQVECIHFFPTIFGVPAQFGVDADFSDLFTSTTTKE